MNDLSPKEAAEFFGVSVCTIWRRIKDGTLQAYKIGGLTRVKRESCENVREVA